jgi:hypothetical protein
LHDATTRGAERFLAWDDTRRVGNILGVGNNQSAPFIACFREILVMRSYSNHDEQLKSIEMQQPCYADIR